MAEENRSNFAATALQRQMPPPTRATRGIGLVQANATGNAERQPNVGGRTGSRGVVDLDG
jgi:hypothetical protein